MKPRSVSSTTIRSKVRASEFVAAAIFCRICVVVAFDPQIALGDPDLGLPVGHVVRGMAAHCSRSAGQFGVGVAGSTVVPARRDGTSSPAAADRSADARSRRTRGWRCSTRLGSDIDPSGADAPE